MRADIRWLAIVNPASGRPDDRAGWRAIEDALRRAGVAFDLIHTEQPGHGGELAHAALLQGHRHIAVAGGDGSVNEVVHGIMNAAFTDSHDVTLAVIPTGTGNDWARTLGIPRDAPRAGHAVHDQNRKPPARGNRVLELRPQCRMVLGRCRIAHLLCLLQRHPAGIETGGVSLRNLTNASGDSFEVLVSGPANDGEAALKGFEVSYVQVYDMLPSFWGNFGVQASYTYVDGSDFTNTTDVNVVRQAIAALQPFAGISEDTVNLALFYEDERWSGRLAYNWRSEYLSTPRDDIFPFSPIFVEDTGQLDGSLFSTINEHMKVGIQGVNLLDEITETSQVLDFGGTRAARSFFRNDRRYTISARLNF